MQDRVQIQQAQDRALQAEAQALLGRLREDGGGGPVHRDASNAYKIPFVVYLDERIVGTLTMGIDSPAGLAIGSTFPIEVAALRLRPGALLCELTKLAFDAAESRPLLAALFGTILQHGTERYGCTDILIEVNPVYRRFYERMLGFEVFAIERWNEKAGASTVAMRIEVTAILRRAVEQTSHSLYAEFTPETGILQVSSAAPSARHDTMR